MNRVIIKLRKWQKITILLLLTYSILSSLLFSEKIGLISIVILALYVIVNFRYPAINKATFIMSLLMLSLAVVLYVLDVTNAMYVPIRKLSEWAYLFLSAGVLQLIISIKFEK